MSMNKIMRSLGSTSTKIARRGTTTLATPTGGFGGASRLYAREVGKEIYPPLFPEATQESKKLAFIAGSAAITLAGITTAVVYEEEIKEAVEDIQDEVDTQVEVFMQSYGNSAYINMMANESFRESVYALREAELLHYGIAFEENKDLVFYRGMTISLPISMSSTSCGLSA